MSETTRSRFAHSVVATRAHGSSVGVTIVHNRNPDLTLTLRAATSISLNIAEGNGKYTAADRGWFFDIARGSALECAACLDVLVAKKRLIEAGPGKAILIRIVSMLVGLIRSTSPDRVYDDRSSYVTRNEKSD